VTTEQQKLFDELSSAKMRKPFKPFSIVLQNGKRYPVKNRWHVAFSEGNRRIVVLLDGRSAYDFFNWDVVAAIETGKPSTSSRRRTA